jgi:hypothetical protein
MKNGRTLRFEATGISPQRLHLVPSTTKQKIDNWTFEFDRLLVSRNLGALSREIENAAIDLALVAAERVFGVEVSEQLLEEPQVAFVSPRFEKAAKYRGPSRNLSSSGERFLIGWLSRGPLLALDFGIPRREPIFGNRS